MAYSQSPAGGWAAQPGLAKLRFLRPPVADEHAVHSLERGAVWITCRPDLPADRGVVRRKLAQENDHVLVSPYGGLPTPVAASAWGFQLPLDWADTVRLRDLPPRSGHGAGRSALRRNVVPHVLTVKAISE